MGPSPDRPTRATRLLPIVILAAVVLAGCTTPDAYRDYFERSEEVVPLRNLAFHPQNLTVPVNTTVVWLNEDTVTDHSVTFEALDLDAWLEPGQRVERTFTEPGVYDYRCRPHSSGYRNWGQMVGRVTVVEG